jgi:XRE family transcriptional regulator, regulator of sulfur utilization
MKTGEKIRFLRTMRGYSQENMADMVGISRQAYGEIERGNSNPSPERVAQIAEKLGVTPNDLEAFGNAVSNFFDQCNGNVNAGTNPTKNNNYDARELQHQLEKLQLELKLCQAEKDKAEMEARYWREKGGEEK